MKKLAIGTVAATSALALAWLGKQKLDQNQQTAQALITRRILIIGATSAIAQETAKIFAQAGDDLYLVARNKDKLQVVVDDLKVRGSNHIHAKVMDVNQFDDHASLIKTATDTLGGLDTVLIAHGTLSDQEACEASYELTEQEYKTNFLSVVSLLTLIANQFEKQYYGTIAVISSVAGDRGRQSNYIYGGTKAALSFYLQGLRNRLSKAGVQVVTIKPGFVDTPMTADSPKNFLFAQPETIARGIYRAIQTKQDIVYLPWFWWGIMAIIKAIPERIFKQLSL